MISGDEGDDRVHPLPSHLAHELHKARQADLYRRPHQPARAVARRRRATRSVRQSAGWFLIELGLRLAAPHAPLDPVQ